MICDISYNNKDINTHTTGNNVLNIPLYDQKEKKQNIVSNYHATNPQPSN